MRGRGVISLRVGDADGWRRCHGGVVPRDHVIQHGRAGVCEQRSAAQRSVRGKARQGKASCHCRSKNTVVAVAAHTHAHTHPHTLSALMRRAAGQRVERRRVSSNDTSEGQVALGVVDEARRDETSRRPTPNGPLTLPRAHSGRNTATTPIAEV